MYLLERQNVRQQKKTGEGIFHPLLHSPNGHDRHPGRSQELSLPHGLQGSKILGHLLLSSRISEKSGWRVEQSGLETVLLGDAGFAGCRLTHYTTMSAPALPKVKATHQNTVGKK